MTNFCSFLILRLEGIWIELVLSSPNWMLSLLSTNQSHMFGKYLFNIYLFISISITSYFVKLGMDHHASCINDMLTVISISLSQIKNNKGPNIDPCDTLHDMLEISEKAIFWIYCKFANWWARSKPFNSIVWKTNNAKFP